MFRTHHHETFRGTGAGKPQSFIGWDALHPLPLAPPLCHLYSHEAIVLISKGFIHYNVDKSCFLKKIKNKSCFTRKMRLAATKKLVANVNFYMYHLFFLIVSFYFSHLIICTV